MLRVAKGVKLSRFEDYGFKKVENKVIFNDWFRGYQKTITMPHVLFDDREGSKITFTIHGNDSVDERGAFHVAVCGYEFDLMDEVVIMDDLILDGLYDLIKDGLLEKVKSKKGEV